MIDSREQPWFHVQTPLVSLAVRIEGDAVREIRFHEGAERPARLPLEVHVAEELVEYAQGCRRTFTVPVQPNGTEFELRVWSELQKIPFGATRSYGSIAKSLGASKAARAVGLANGRNPIPIIIPCHRVIGADGTLTGFGGGLDLKRRLLELEGAIAPSFL
jgi:methylated-DNA-[protein]-cysteine S-methyltransferase